AGLGEPEAVAVVGSTDASSRLRVAAAPSEAMSDGPAGRGRDAGAASEPEAEADAPEPEVGLSEAEPEAEAEVGSSEPDESVSSLVSRQSTNWPSSLPDTSARTPRPNWATRPVMVRSVTTATSVPSP